MYRIHALMAATMLALLTWGCASDLADAVGPYTSRENGRSNNQNYTVSVRYQYAGYDHESRQVVKGFITIVRDESNSISGDWQLEATGDPSGIGPQVGSGKLVGAVDGERIWIGLNPDYVDNNVMLAGRISGSVISGTWEYVGFPGVLAQGTFRAVKVRDRAQVSTRQKL